MSTAPENHCDVGVASEAMQLKHLGAQLRYWARKSPQRPALSFASFLGAESGGEALSYRELDHQVGVIAQALRSRTNRGDRVAITAAPSTGYVVALLACLRAGLTAVPLFSPDLPGHGDRLGAIFVDCAPATVVSAGGNGAVVERFLQLHPFGDRIARLDVDELLDLDNRIGLVAPTGDETAPDDVCYLQYSAGATRAPVAARITRSNLTDAARRWADDVFGAVPAERQPTLVSWQPLFHHLGLGAVLSSLAAGAQVVLMDPIAFLVSPDRWLAALGAHRDVVSLAPNFAFDYCSAKLAAAPLEHIDLSGVCVLIDAGEPVRVGSLERFAATFAPLGLRSDALRVGYALSEAAGFVALTALNAPLTTTTLAPGSAATAGGSDRVDNAPDSSTVRLVSVGQVSPAHVTIGDPAAGAAQVDGQVGEIWLRGAGVADGYWNHPALTVETFGQQLQHSGAADVTVTSDTIDSMSRADSASARTAEGAWVRTGDLGVIHGGELFITGRIKDLIIIAGRNHSPQELEATIEQAHEVIGRHRTAAFSVPAADGDGVVVVAEISRDAARSGWDSTAVSAAIRTRLSQQHSVAALDVVLVEPNSVARSASGKVERAATRKRYLAGELVPAGRGE